MKRSNIQTLIVLVIAATVLLTSCGRIELYQNLSEEDANEILVLLSEHGLKATKKKVIAQNEVSYTVTVPESQMVRARSLLVQEHLPRRKELGLTGVYKEKGLIPTPDEQKARFLLALKGEIINSLERIPQIVDADVVLNVPIKDEFADVERQKSQRPTASVVVRIRPDATGLEALTEQKIQQFVANTVEGLNPRDVAVVITYVQTGEKMLRPGDVRTLSLEPQVSSKAEAQARPDFSHELAGLKLDQDSKGRLKVYLLAFFLVLVILSVALIVVIIQGSRTRRELDRLVSGGQHPAIEGEVLDESPPRLGGGQ